MILPPKLKLIVIATFDFGKNTWTYSDVPTVVNTFSNYYLLTMQIIRNVNTIPYYSRMVVSIKIRLMGGGGIHFNITLNEKQIRTVKIKPKSLGKINFKLNKFYNNF